MVTWMETVKIQKRRSHVNNLLNTHRGAHTICTQIMDNKSECSTIVDSLATAGITAVS